MTANALTEEQIQAWAREQFQRANKFLAERGIVYDSVFAEDCRYLVPFVAVWKIKALDKQVYWVITGDVPLDVTYFDSADNAREAMKYFSMHWQLKAENLEVNNTANDSSQTEYIELLRTKAEQLYALQDNDAMWGTGSAN
ncbi:DUF4826 family protein [Alteromonas gilva]|uniref:DUF4826 family protein n=1 Tax=Alteromonas gilva TaxID=2987522 RepID=A0ABT5L1S6_9ALTE|nr:DUF4826 family protein [Alteromonas gilva]MDC8830833.1 DUF4826 family protein [Alteromonas gilva]